MGREIRRVPPDWQHPKNARGHYQPLFDRTYAEALDDYQREKAAWEAEGSTDRLDYEGEVGHPVPFSEWNGEPPNPDYYRPAWPEGSATAFQVYETVSEGSPVSPVFTTRDALVEYLVTDGGGMGIGGVPMRLSRPAAERFVDATWAPSMTMVPGVGVLQNAQMYEAPSPRPAPSDGAPSREGDAK